MFSLSTFAIYFFSTRSEICPIFHLQLHKEYFETTTSLNNVEINPGPRPIDENPVFCCNKINRGVQQDMAPTCSDENCNAWCHQACNGLSISQTRHAKNSGLSLSPGNVLNMALESPKLLSHLRQFMKFHTVPLLLGNLASFAEILSALVMPIWLTIVRTQLAITFVTLQPRVAGSQTLEEPQEHVLFPPVSGIVISTLHHQQLPIHHHHLTTHLLVPYRHHRSPSWIKACL